MLDFIPKDFLGVIELYGTVPLTDIGIGQLYNIIFVVGIVVFIFIHDRNSKTYAKGMVKKHAMMLLDGKTGKGKTRLLTQISKDAKEQNKNTIIISNFLNGYGDFYFASLQDFRLLQVDIARLGEFSNFTQEEKKEIEKHFPGYFSFLNESDFSKKIKKIKGKYDILTLGDEWYSYFHNRNFMGNFSKKNGMDELLLDLHQTRHSNQTIVLASQDDDNLDLDFRQIAHNEINVFSFFMDLIYGFNKFVYLSKKEIKEYGIEFKKQNWFPYLFFNWYELNEKINSLISIYCSIFNVLFIYDVFRGKTKKFGIFAYFGVKKRIFYKRKFFEKKFLKFHTKFNIKKNINIYQPGFLYDYIIGLEKKLDK